MLLKDLLRSRLPKSFTEYQLGTELYWWLRRFPPEVERVEQLMALAVVPIVSDESESWLAGQPAHLRVTIEDALKAIEHVRSTPGLRLDVLARILREHDAEEEAIKHEEAVLAARSVKNEARLRECAAALYMQAPTAESVQSATLTLRSRPTEIDAGKARTAELFCSSLRVEFEAARALKAHVHSVLGTKELPESTLLAQRQETERQESDMRQAAAWILREEQKRNRRKGPTDA